MKPGHILQFIFPGGDYCFFNACSLGLRFNEAPMWELLDKLVFTRLSSKMENHQYSQAESISSHDKLRLQDPPFFIILIVPAKLAHASPCFGKALEDCQEAELSLEEIATLYSSLVSKKAPLGCTKKPPVCKSVLAQDQHHVLSSYQQTQRALHLFPPLIRVDKMGQADESFSYLG